MSFTWQTDKSSAQAHMHVHTDGILKNIMHLAHLLDMHAHTHTHLTALCPGLPGTRKVKPIWILLEQETVSGSGISWTMCKSAPCSRQITMPAPTTQFFTGRMPFLPPNQHCQSTKGSAYLLDMQKHQKQFQYLLLFQTLFQMQKAKYPMSLWTKPV